MSMSDAEVQQLLEQPLVGVLGTSDADGKPALAPVWYRWRGEDAVVCTGRTSRKWRNIERDPRVTLCVDVRESPYRAVIIEGTAEAEPGADYLETLRDVATHYLGEEGAAGFMAGYEYSEDSVVVRIRPERVISWAY